MNITLHYEDPDRPTRVLTEASHDIETETGEVRGGTLGEVEFIGVHPDYDNPSLNAGFIARTDITDTAALLGGWVMFKDRTGIFTYGLKIGKVSH